MARELAPGPGGGARLIRQDRGVFDTFPLSLVTTQSIAWLAESTGVTLDPQRFRPNLLVEAVGDAPFAEDSWVGSTLRIGGLRLRIDKRDGRCLVVTLDPATGESEPAILRLVARERDGCFGVYGTTVTPGRIAVGDELFVERG